MNATMLRAGYIGGLALALAIGGAIAPLGAQPLPASAVKPDPSHVVGVLPADIPWRRTGAGQMQATLFGDPAKPGPYGILIKWLPGHMSRPHYHSTDRWAYVVSGTWWVSTSRHFDPATTYPYPAGSFVTDLADTVHWDGAKDEEVVLELVGMGPVTTTSVPEQ